MCNFSVVWKSPNKYEKQQKINRQIETLYIYCVCFPVRVEKQSKKKRILTTTQNFLTRFETGRRSYEKSLNRANNFFSLSVCVCLLPPFKLHSWCVFNWALMFWIHAKCCFLNLYNQSVYKKEIIWRVFVARSLPLSRFISHTLSHTHSLARSSHCCSRTNKVNLNF